MSSATARRRWVLGLARAYTRRRLRRSLDGVFVDGLERTAALAARAPLVIAANHVAWWDPLLMVALDEALGTESYALMDAANLRRLPMFGWIGAIPLDRTSPRAALRDLRAAARLADRSGRLLWIFPQGEQRPAHLRPLGFHAGVERLARQSGAGVVPLSLCYAFADDPRPRAYAAFAPAVSLEPGVQRGALVGRIEAGVVEGLARIDRAHLAGGEPFTPLFGPHTGPALPLGGRILAALARRGGGRV